jgi:drug/metabolite transporter (DMT)-like permease
MSPLALGLIIAAAFAHAAWNVAAKRAGASGVGFVWLSSAVSAALLLPIGLTTLIVTHGDVARWALAAGVSGVFQAAYFLLLQRGYRHGELSVVYPLARGTGPIVSVVLAIAILGERPALIGIVGGMVIVAGIVVIGLTALGHLDPAKARAGVLFGVLTGFTIAAYTLWDSNSVNLLAVAPLAMTWGATTTQTVLIAPFALRQPSAIGTAWREHWREVIVVGVLSPLAYGLVLFALTLAPVALVAPGREISVVLASLAGLFLLHEGHARQRLIGAAVVLVGIVLIALA